VCFPANGCALAALILALLFGFAPAAPAQTLAEVQAKIEKLRAERDEQAKAQKEFEWILKELDGKVLVNIAGSPVLMSLNTYVTWLGEMVFLGEFSPDEVKLRAKAVKDAKRIMAAVLKSEIDKMETAISRTNAELSKQEAMRNKLLGKENAGGGGARLTFEKASVNHTGMVAANDWRVDESGSATWTLPSAEVTYKITPPAAITPGDPGAEFKIGIDLTVKPRNRFNAVANARGDVDFDPNPAAYQLYVEAGENKAVKNESKTFTIKSRKYSFETKHVDITVGIQDGPTFSFRYRVER
jgi:hypothetical protein